MRTFVPPKETVTMNYEELLASRSDGKLNKTQLPIGEYYRMQVDGKYRGVVDINQELNDSIVFSEALKAECAQNRTLAHRYQLHFTPAGEGSDTTQLEVETGVFLSLEQLLSDTPAAIAEKEFFVNLLQNLVEVTSYLHEKGIWHICYSPKTVFIRKGDRAAMLLSHGSFYLGMNDQAAFYGGDASYVAPEVLAHGTIDSRCDVYSLGKLMETLLARMGMPLEYKKIVKKAISEKPEDRYASPEELLKAVQRNRNTYKSVLMFAAAVVIALVCVGLFFDSMPESTQVEFVKPVPRQATDDLIDDGFSPEELGVTNADSIQDEDYEARRNFQAKAEQIFRKKYEIEADRILSKIYNKDYMSNSEKKFLSESQSTIDELMKMQQKLGEEADLTPERSQLIATEIIDRITEKKKREMGNTNKYGIQK